MIRIKGCKIVRASTIRTKDADGLPSRARHGRFHYWDFAPCYLADRAKTAFIEVFSGFPQKTLKAFVCLHVEAELTNIVDLTDRKVARQHGTSEFELTGEDHAPCQRLAYKLRAEGVEAVWTYSSKHPGGRVLVIFLDKLLPTSKVTVTGVTPVAISMMWEPTQPSSTLKKR